MGTIEYTTVNGISIPKNYGLLVTTNNKAMLLAVAFVIKQIIPDANFKLVYKDSGRINTLGGHRGWFRDLDDIFYFAKSNHIEVNRVLFMLVTLTEQKTRGMFSNVPIYKTFERMALSFNKEFMVDYLYYLQDKPKPPYVKL